MNIITFIKENFFTAEEIDSYQVENKVEKVTDSPSLAYHYFERYLTSLNPTLVYDIREELKSGAIVTHEVGVTHERVKEYTRMVWIDIHPPKFIIDPTTLR